MDRGRRVTDQNSIDGNPKGFADRCILPGSRILLFALLRSGMATLSTLGRLTNTESLRDRDGKYEMNLSAAMQAYPPAPKSGERIAYRPAIDGLRAVAVALVIAFHFDIPPFQGGFIGVDVFFVISGYLIIGMIKRELEIGVFSFSDFYARRVRRILPALVMAVCLSLILGIVIFSPEDLGRLGITALWSVLSVVNVYFWRHTDYFTDDSGSQPLLHIWSLSVEEQMYLFTPALLAALAVGGRRMGGDWLTFVVLAGLCMASFACAEVLVRAGAQAAAFYLLPSRFGEFAAGGLLCWLPPDTPHRFGRRRDLFGWIAVACGLAVIFWTAIVITPIAPFPGTLALLPVAGTVLVIVGQQSGGRVPLLATRPLIMIGLVSYSLYLMHWIVYSYARYWLDRDLSVAETTVAILLSGVLAATSYRFVEEPARRSRRFASYVFVAGTGAAGALAGVLGLAVYMSDGLPSRLDQDRREMVDAAAYHLANYGGTGFSTATELKLGDPNATPSFIIAGDSIARQYAGGLDALLRSRGGAAIGFFQDGCIMADGLTRRGSLFDTCLDATAGLREILARETLPVIFSFGAKLYPGGIVTPDDRLVSTDVETFASAVAAGVRGLFTSAIARGGFALLLASPALGSSSPIRCLTRPTFVPQPCVDHQVIPLDVAIDRHVQPEFVRALLAESPGIKVIDVTPELCGPEGCRRLRDGEALYSDRTHLSITGSRYVATSLLSQIDEAFPAAHAFRGRDPSVETAITVERGR